VAQRLEARATVGLDAQARLALGHAAQAIDRTQRHADGVARFLGAEQESQLDRAFVARGVARARS
jgi:hypothetical protein